jgi:DNA-binding transcriptional ArsR family regulator
MVAAHQGQEACVCNLTEPLGLSQPTVSHHLPVLTEAGVFSRSKRGTWVYNKVPLAYWTVSRPTHDDLPTATRSPHKVGDVPARPESFHSCCYLVL